MVKAFFLAIGISMCILGAECLVVEKAVMASGKATAQPKPRRAFPMMIQLRQPAQPQREGREFEPPEWAPWSLLATGAIVILYSFTIPRRFAG